MIYLEGRRQDVDALVFSPDGMRAAAAGKTGRVALWDFDV